MKKPKLVFVAQSSVQNEYLDQSSRYRVYNPAKAFAKAGYDVVVVRDKYDDDFPTYGDIYLFHRPVYSAAFIKVIDKLESAGAKLFADFDDLNFDPSTITQNSFFKIRDRRSVSDHAALLYEAASFFRNVLTSSVALTEEAQRIFPEAVCTTIGMGVDDALFDHVVANREIFLSKKDRRSVGYFAGSNTHKVDFPLIEEAVFALLESHALHKFILMGAIEPTLRLRSKPNFIHLPRMPYEQIFEHAATCKAIVAPLETNRFNRVKASTKLLENSLVFAHTISSPNPEFDRTGLAYIKVDGEDGWMNALSLSNLRSLDHQPLVENFENISEKFLMSRVIAQYKDVMSI